VGRVVCLSFPLAAGRGEIDRIRAIDPRPRSRHRSLRRARAETADAPSHTDRGATRQYAKARQRDPSRFRKDRGRPGVRSARRPRRVRRQFAPVARPLRGGRAGSVHR